MSVEKKLRLVYANAPKPLKKRIARVIFALGKVEPQGVSAPVNKRTKVVDTTLTMLQDHADSFLSLMRTLPKDHEFKKLVGNVSSLTESLQEKLKNVGEELSEILETDEDDLPGIKASALGELSQMFEVESAKLADLMELTSTLNTLAGKVHKEKKTEPVEHDVQDKDVTPDKKKKDKEEGDEEQDAGDDAMKELNEMFST